MFLFTTPPTRNAAAATTPVVDAIRQGAERTGVGFDYLLATAQRESALDPKAQARSSSASGLFQFVEQTWLGMVKGEGGKAGLSDYARAISTRSDGTHAVQDPALRREILDLRQDPTVASVLAGALTQKNREALNSALGREPTSGDLYAAHFLGARGAADLIQAAAQDPTRSMAESFPDAAAANRQIFFDGNGRARGAGEVYALLAGAKGMSAAPAFGPDRPVAFARQDGPAFHGLFQSENRSGPISEAVAKLWRGSRPEAGVKTAGLSFFPNSTGASATLPEQTEPTESPQTAPMPLPPRRPEAATSAPGRSAKPLDLARFMRWQKS